MYPTSMNAPSSEVEVSSRLRNYEDSLDEIEAGNQHLLSDSLTHVALFSFYILFQGTHLLVSVEPLLSAQFLQRPAFMLAGAAIALVAAGYIAVSFFRQRRDIITNEIRDLRLRLSHITALEQARTPNGLATDAGR